VIEGYGRHVGTRTPDLYRGKKSSRLTYWYFTASTVPWKYVDVRLATACCTQICAQDFAPAQAIIFCSWTGCFCSGPEPDNRAMLDVLALVWPRVSKVCQREIWSYF